MSQRRLFDVALRPTQGSRFAPTGFPDLGTAEFDRPTPDDGWERCILVESAQSMANRLEATLWDAATDAPIPLIERLPYVRVLNAGGSFITSSRTESHRLASPYVRKATLGDRTVHELLVEELRLVENTPLDYRSMARTLLSRDPLVLVHGVFFAGQKGGDVFPGQPKFARVLSAFIEAADVRRADSGGVKRDHVSHTQEESGSDSTEGYGSIPFPRTEWTARTITASFNLDLAQVRSYGLPEAAEGLLLTLARYEIAALLSGSLRLRTNCDLEVTGDAVTDRDGEALPPLDRLTGELGELIERCADEGLVGEGATEVTWARKGR